MYSGYTLLDGGAIAFDEIIKSINNAKSTIKINMFIWRADKIGTMVASALLDAANRGVKIDISVDRYGLVLERAEESMESFFHTNPSVFERVKIAFLKWFYKTEKVPFEDLEKACKLRDLLLAHSNIKVEKDRFKADHSKYYIIDNEVLFLGGINIEDKEIWIDFKGRQYQDYMVKIVDNRAIARFLDKISGKNQQKTELFCVNLKSQNKLFEIKKVYLDIINNAEKELYITMAYLSPIKEFEQAIIKAFERGVKVVMTIPKSANFQDDLNKKTVKRLLIKTNNKIVVRFSPKMVHTKLIASEKTISLGSSNVNKKAMFQLDEVNLLVKNEECSFVRSIFDSIEENAKISSTVKSSEVKYNKIRAFLEGILM